MDVLPFHELYHVRNDLLLNPNENQAVFHHLRRDFELVEIFDAYTVLDFGP